MNDIHTRRFLSYFENIYYDIKNIDVENVDIKSILYRGNASSFVESQFTKFKQQPDRLVISDLRLFNPGPKVQLAVQPLNGFFETTTGSSLAEAPVIGSGYFFIFGLGLGLHLPMILEAFDFQDLVIIEPSQKILRHSLDTFDWDDFLDLCDEKGIKVHLINPKNETHFSAALVSVLAKNPASWLLDGSYVFMHLMTEETVYFRKVFNEKVRSLTNRTGYFEDEIIMMKNMIGNARNPKSRVLETEGKIDFDRPVFIVGSGPSIDQDIDQIAKHAGKAVIVSCGSAFSVLHKNGVVPDFHFETENLQLVPETLETWRENYTFGETVFLASVTVHPDSMAYFAQQALFVRHGVSAASAIGDGSLTFKFSGPVATNAAFSTLAALGARQLYLFGVDCGVKDEGHHHSKDSLYFEEGNEEIPIEKAYDREIAANFGQGTIKTSYLLQSSALSLAFAIKLFDVEVFNCSDGARIELAKPLKSRDLKLPDIDKPKEPYGAGIRIASTPFQDLALNLPTRQSCEAFQAALEALLSPATGGSEEDFVSLAKRLCAFVEGRKAASCPILPIVESTSISMLQIGAYFAHRIPDGTVRQRFYLFYVSLMTRCLADCVSEIKAELCDN